METKILRQFEGAPCNIILRNNYVYKKIVFSIGSDGIITFSDNKNKTVYVEAGSIVSVTEADEAEQ